MKMDSGSFNLIKISPKLPPYGGAPKGVKSIHTMYFFLKILIIYDLRSSNQEKKYFDNFPTDYPLNNIKGCQLQKLAYYDHWEVITFGVILGFSICTECYSLWHVRTSCCVNYMSSYSRG